MQRAWVSAVDDEDIEDGTLGILDTILVELKTKGGSKLVQSNVS